MPHDLRPLLERVAGALDAARHDLERLSATLCADTDVALRHITALQALDGVGQCQAELAMLLRAHDPLAAVATVRLDRLRTHLTAGTPA